MRKSSSTGSTPNCCENRANMKGKLQKDEIVIVSRVGGLSKYKTILHIYDAGPPILEENTLYLFNVEKMDGFYEAGGYPRAAILLEDEVQPTESGDVDMQKIENSEIYKRFDLAVLNQLVNEDTAKPVPVELQRDYGFDYTDPKEVIKRTDFTFVGVVGKATRTKAPEGGTNYEIMNILNIKDNILKLSGGDNEWWASGFDPSNEMEKYIYQFCRGYFVVYKPYGLSYDRTDFFVTNGDDTQIQEDKLYLFNVNLQEDGTLIADYNINSIIELEVQYPIDGRLLNNENPIVETIYEDIQKSAIVQTYRDALQEIEEP